MLIEEHSRVNYLIQRKVGMTWFDTFVHDLYIISCENIIEDGTD